MGECLHPQPRRGLPTRSDSISGSTRQRRVPSRKWMFRISVLLAVFIISTVGFHSTRIEESKYNGNYHASRSLLSTTPDEENLTCGSGNPNLPFWEQCEYECNTIPALWVLLYAICIIILFIGLAIVCDEFFVPSLEAISEKLDLSEDVAGATFMAAGSSAPELFTSILGVSFGSDVGVGTIVGSAVFNILIIIALTAALAGKVLVLDPRPLLRDSVFYALSIICFILFSWDGQLMWYESLILLILYAVYIFMMKFNTLIMERVCIKGSVAPVDDDENKLEELKNVEPVQTANTEDADKPAATLPQIDMTHRKDSVHSRTSEDYHGSKHIFHHVKQGEFAHHFVKRNSIMVHLKHGEHHHNQFHLDHKESVATTMTSSSLPETEETIISEEVEEGMTLRPIPCFCAINTYYPDMDGETGYCAYAHLVLKWVLFFISFPFMCLFTYTIPNCATPRFQKFYHLSFVMSIVWIAALSFVMVTLVTKAGCILNVDHYTMGLVIVAIGTSVPDALSSVLVARDGFGDMAVSNAIGSNVFDINLGIGLPYFMRNIISNFQPVNLLNEYETEMRAAGQLPITPHAKFGFILLLILALALLTFTCVRFRLNWIVGVSFVSMYVAFLIYAFIQELVCDYSC